MLKSMPSSSLRVHNAYAGYIKYLLDGRRARRVWERIAVRSARGPIAQRAAFAASSGIVVLMKCKQTSKECWL